RKAPSGADACSKTFRTASLIDFATPARLPSDVSSSKLIVRSSIIAIELSESMRVGGRKRVARALVSIVAIEFPGSVGVDSGETSINHHPDETEVLDQQLWKALVSDRDDIEWFLDLETLTVVEVPLTIEGKISPEAEPIRTPERFLSVP